MTDLLYVVLLAAAAYTDARTRRIPDKIIFCLLALGMCNIPNTGAAGAVTGLLAGAVPFLAAALADKAGGGDMKYMAANGLYLGVQVIPAVIIAMTFFLLTAWIGRKKQNTRLPLAPSLSFGCLCVLIAGRFL